MSIAQIKHTGLRRAALVLVAAPAVAILLSPQLIRALGECFVAAWEGFTDEWWNQFTNASGARYLRAAWDQMWSEGWVAK